tara:strand:- start:1009 stop:1176 length:168 start_codon:yes stop_codon:yes gene_type:complete
VLRPSGRGKKNNLKFFLTNPQNFCIIYLYFKKEEIKTRRASQLHKKGESDNYKRL